MIGLKICLLGLFVISVAMSLRRVVTSVFAENFFQRDLIQEYVMAKAIVVGGDPYLPTIELVRRFVPSLPVEVFAHPSPHPPPLALLSLPLTLLSYEHAIVFWFVIQITGAIVLVLLLRPTAHSHNWWETLLLILLFIAWEPVVWDLALGQLSLILLVLLVVSWRFLRTGRGYLGGFFLGTVVALKLMAWPIVIYLALRRKWRVVISVGLVVFLANLVGILIIGLDRVLAYYTVVAPSVSQIYRATSMNTSVYSLVWSLFVGTKDLIWSSVETTSMFSMSTFAPLVAILVSLLFAGIGIWKAFQMQTFDGAFALLICVSVLVGPITWRHYFTWLVIPLTVVVCYLSTLNFPSKLSQVMICVLGLAGVSWYLPDPIIKFLTGLYIQPATLTTVPFAVGIVTYVPSMVAVILMILLVRVYLLNFSG